MLEALHLLPCSLRMHPCPPLCLSGLGGSNRRHRQTLRQGALRSAKQSSSTRRCWESFERRNTSVPSWRWAPCWCRGRSSALPRLAWAAASSVTENLLKSSILRLSEPPCRNDGGAGKGHSQKTNTATGKGGAEAALPKVQRRAQPARNVVVDRCRGKGGAWKTGAFRTRAPISWKIMPVNANLLCTFLAACHGKGQFGEAAKICHSAVDKFARYALTQGAAVR